MPQIITPAIARQAARHLSRHDPVLAPIIKAVGPCTIQPHKDYYWELIDSIISQQLSVKAAASIERRFQELLGNPVPAPEAILAKSVEELRTAGLSGAKANYIRDLAQNIIDGTIKFDQIDSQTNQEIIDELTGVKGIGEWTAHMFLIFCIGRPDVLPTGDLGIRNAVRQLYDFKDLPTPQEITKLAEQSHWQPYESIASWYLWHSLDNKPAL
jgi:DNA-3-methyladenine glycosylase II